MIDSADQDLRDWVESVLPDVEISFAPPATDWDNAIVNLYLIELRDAGTRRSPRQEAQAQVSLRYLISTWAADNIESHRMLGALLFAALERREFEIDLNPLPPETWTALGTLPRPAFVLQTPVRLPRGGRTAPIVRAPLVIEHAPTARLEGVVVGPDDVPISDAQVELAGLGHVTRTDRAGRFRFGIVPAGERALELRIEARGLSARVSAPELPETGEQLVIRFDPAGR
jgi:hypothetical protein